MASRHAVGGVSYATRGAAPLVGRRAELDWLLQELEAAEAGEPRLVFVHGDAGIGKSRLARELARRASGRGFTVASGRCREDLALPYLPLTTSLLPLLEPYLENDERGSGGDGLPRPARLGETPSSDSPSAGAEHDRMRLFLALTRAALRLAGERPLLLIVDDIQWIDGPSLELLRHTVLTATDYALRDHIALMVLCTHRPRLDAAVEAELARLRREECTAELDLYGLSEPEAAELMRVLGLHDVDRRVMSSVYEVTGGNALFIETVVRNLRGHIDAATSPMELVAPADLSQALDATLDRLSAQDRDVLTIAAILGDETSIKDLQRIRPAAAVDRALAAAEPLGIVVRRTLDVRFAHPLYAHLLRSAPDPAARNEYHRTVAEALAAADAPSGRALEVARHLIAAGESVAPGRLLDAARQGGEQALALFAWGDAARCSEAAADAAARLGHPDPEVAQLRLQAGRAYRLNLDEEAARANLTLATGTFRRSDDSAGLASALLELGMVELGAGQLDTAIDLGELQELAEHLEAEDPGLAGRLLAQMASWFTTLDRLDRAGALAARALHVALEASDDAAAVQAQTALATLAWTRLDLHDARSRLEDALIRAGDDPWLANRARPRLALTLLWLGQLTDAEAAAQQACDEARRTADWSSLTLALAAAAGVATARGERHRASQLGEEAWLAMRLSSYRWGAAFVLPALAAARIAGGDLVGAHDALEGWRMLSSAKGGGDSGRMLVNVAELMVRALEGKPVELPAWVLPVLARWPARVGAVMVPAVLAALAEAGLCSVPDAPLEQALTDIADSGMLLTDGLLFLVPRVRGLAALAANRLDDAQTHLSEAVRVAGAIDAAAEGARAELDLARAHWRAGDVVAARTRARSAADTAGSLGMVSLAAAATALLSELSAERQATPSALPATMAVILFTDLVGSTELTERMGDAPYRAMADRLDADLRIKVDASGGEVVPGIRLGDGFLALFGSARGALAFAAEAHKCATSHDVSLRVGVHAGDLIRAGDIVSGGSVNIAARVCDLAAPDETLVSETIRSLARTSAGTSFEDRGEHRLKGVSDPYHLFSIHTGRV